MSKVLTIEYPNTCQGEDFFDYTVGRNCDNIYTEYNEDSGTWMYIVKNDNIIAEIKKSVCNVYYEKKKKQLNTINKIENHLGNIAALLNEIAMTLKYPPGG